MLYAVDAECCRTYHPTKYNGCIQCRQMRNKQKKKKYKIIIAISWLNTGHYDIYLFYKETPLATC